MIQAVFNIQSIDDNREIVICQLPEWESWTQLHECVAMYGEIAADLTEPVHFVIEFGEITAPQPWSLADLHKMMSFRRHVDQVTVLVCAPRVLRVFMRIAQQVYDVWSREPDFRFADSMAEALAMLQTATPKDLTTLDAFVSPTIRPNPSS